MIDSVFTTSGDAYKDVVWETRNAKLGDFEQKEVEVPQNWSQDALNIVAQKYFMGSKDSSERETSVAQMIDRVCDTITSWGERYGYFSSDEGGVFSSELKYMIVNQLASFNSPVWFNVGTSYNNNQVSACYILSIEDSMSSILEWYKQEGMIFKFGSGAGVNLSNLRGNGEGLTGGGQASGPVSFMRGADASAGSIKSGGRTRRAAKLVTLDIDHPDIEEFIWCKEREERKQKVLQDAGFDMSINGKDVATIQYQNANNSIRITDDFMKAVDRGDDWSLIARSDGSVTKTIDANDLIEQISKAAWMCADPGVQYDTTINDWHTMPKHGRINASNPCCFTGDVLVDTSEGNKSFEELYSSYLMGEILPKAFSFDLDENLPDLKQIKNVWVAGVTTNLVRVTTDKGLSFTCTPEHNFLTKSGRYVEAQNLRVGQSLRKIGRSINQSRSNCRVINHRATDNQPNGTSWQARYMWESAYGEIPVGMQVNHINGDPTDDRLSNFRLIHFVDHQSQDSSGEGNGRYIDVDIDRLLEIYLNLIDQCNNITTYRWNKYIDDNGLKGVVPKAANVDGGIRGMSWSEFKELLDSELEKQNDKVLSVEEIVLDEPIKVYDIEVEDTHNFAIANNGILHSVVVHNSEYVHIDNSSCNLASLNLKKFYKNGEFFVDDFIHAVRVLFTAQDILISEADFPTDEIAQNTRNFRQIGIGYTNLGALLMSMGIPYESKQGYEIAGAITSLMTGTAYAQSGYLAKEVGAFADYETHKNDMVRVLEKHKSYVNPVVSNEIARDIMLRTVSMWDTAIEYASTVGVRNSQASVIAPTGTISFMMGADTLGIEPDFSLIKEKTLVGGGKMQLTNQSVAEGLYALGYSQEQVEKIEEYLHNNYTIYGAPYLHREHYDVFACAVGKGAISPYGHVNMMAAVQPFLSGSISKTVNMPEESTVEDIKNIYIDAWRMGLKSIAIYRDGSKVFQPLSSKRYEQPVSNRQKLDKRRSSVTYAFKVGESKGYLTVGEYPDGSPGEIFVKLGKQGSTLAGFMDAFAVGVSVGLQYGVPLEDLVSKYLNVRFEPAGITDDPEIRFASSIVDYIARRLAIDYLPSEKLENLGISFTEGSINVKEEQESFSQSADTICTGCGSIMIQAGSCFACPSCGSTTGCS